MQLNKEFAKLKLPSTIKELYSSESSRRRMVKGSSFDERIEICYATVQNKNYTKEWCADVKLLVDDISKAEAAIVKCIKKMQEFNEMKSMVNYVVKALQFSETVKSIKSTYLTAINKYDQVYSKNAYDCYVALKTNSKDIDELTAFVQAVSDVSSSASDAILKYLTSEILKLYHDELTLAITMRKILSVADKYFKAIDFADDIDILYEEYIEYARLGLAEYKKSENALYQKMKKDANLDHQITEFCKSTKPLAKQKTSVDENLVRADSLKKAKEIFGCYNTLLGVVNSRDMAFLKIDFEKNFGDFKNKHLAIINNYLNLYKESITDFYVKYKGESQKVDESLQKAAELGKQFDKIGSANFNTDISKQMEKIKNAYTAVASYLTEKVKALKAIELNEEIESDYSEYLKLASNIHKQFNKKPDSVCCNERILVGNLYVDDLVTKLSKTMKKITKDSQKFISNMDILTDLNEELACLLEIQSLYPYYQFIKAYPYKKNTERYYTDFIDLNKDLNNRRFKYIVFPFNDKWKDVTKVLERYDKKQVRKRVKKYRRKKALRTFLAIIFFPITIIVLLFKLLRKLVRGIFSGMAECPFIYPIISSVVTIGLTVLAFLGFYKFTTFTDFYRTNLAVIVLAVSIITVVGVIKNRDDYDYFDCPVVYLILSIVVTLLPLSLIFLKDLLRINVFMEIFAGMVMILSAVKILTCDDSSDDEAIAYILTQFILGISAIVAHAIMRRICDATVMYVFFYILLVLMEIYLLCILVKRSLDGWGNLKPIIIYGVGALIMIVAFLCFGLAALSKSYLWYAIPGVLVALGIELWGFCIEVDD